MGEARKKRGWYRDKLQLLKKVKESLYRQI